MIGGLAASAWGVTTAMRARRAMSLFGAVVGALGLALALLGAADLSVPGFL